jgi:hypothetical protein
MDAGAVIGIVLAVVGIVATVVAWLVPRELVMRLFTRLGEAWSPDPAASADETLVEVELSDGGFTQGTDLPQPTTPWIWPAATEARRSATLELTTVLT